MTEVSNRTAQRRERGPQRTEGAVSAVSAFDVVVTRVQRLSANFQRITFGGSCLRNFGVQGPTLDLRIKVLIPATRGDDAPRVNMRELLESPPEGSGWYQQWLAMDPAERGAMRTYTVRAARCDGDEPEIDVDFVMHFDAEGNGGPASLWAAAATPGDRMWLIGPNVHAATCTTAGSYGGIEWRPGLAQHVLLAGDETAVPAISAILESLPADVGGHAFLEVPDPADFQAVSTTSAVKIIWLARGERPHGELLDAAVRDAVRVPGWVSLATPFAVGVDASSRAGLTLAAAAAATAGPEPEEVNIDETILWETPQRLNASTLNTSLNPDRPSGALPFYAWIAGEAAVVRGLRRYLVRDVGIDRKQVAFMGYWRSGRSELG
ncbi:siderophore-interacting protein [Arthrobacter flavus]|uniref:Siderophore-interacting protein n=1 Tax=Arthrobacter flavus TaxID=95172 RepID=A0ABW4Q3Z7_9MICC